MGVSSGRTLFVTRIIVAALISAAAMLAQKPTQGIERATLVLPMPGTPLSAEITEERTTKLPDGTSKTEVTTSRAYRDGAGRLRTEMDIASPSGGPSTIVIFSIPDGFMAGLIPAEKMAGRFQFPNEDRSKMGFGFSRPGPLITAPGKRTSKTENLGKQTIDGIEYEGTRTTTTVEDQPSIIGVEEEWTAPLGLIGLMKSSGPDMQVTAKLHVVDRNDPDPRLFEIPPDYSIRELRWDDPRQ
jgi:hypothetical protein